MLRQETPNGDAPQPPPHLLNLNLSCIGREVLGEIRRDEHLKCIPVSILTTENDEQDVPRAHNLPPNYFITKSIVLAASLA